MKTVSLEQNPRRTASGRSQSARFAVKLICAIALAITTTAAAADAAPQTLTPPVPSASQMVTDTVSGSGHPSFVETLPHIKAGNNLQVWVSWNQLYAQGVILVQASFNGVTQAFTNVLNQCATTSCQSLYILPNSDGGTATITVTFNIIGPGVTYTMSAEEIPASE